MKWILIVMGQTPSYRTSIKLEHHFEHPTNSNVFIYWWSNSNTWILSNIEPNRAFTRFTKSLIKLTRTSFFEHRKISNVFITYILVIEVPLKWLQSLHKILKRFQNFSQMYFGTTNIGAKMSSFSDRACMNINQ